MQRLASTTHRASRAQDGRGPRFKKGGKDKFLRSVHQALLENADDVDDDLLANLADSFPPSVDVDDDEPPQDLDPSAASTDTADETILDDSAAQALAAIGLDQLLNW
jgi:hypothetical protein